MKKGLILILSIVMVVCISISATLAYLFVETGSVVNTFEYGDINIELWENDYVLSSNSLDTSKKVTSEADYKMVPGNAMPKNPTVTVLKDSEACWLFVEVKESENFDDFMTYAIAEGWTLYNTTISGSNIKTDNTTADTYVIYREVGAVAANTDFEILANNQVSVKNTVLKTDLNALGTMPTLTFTAYAVQKDNVTSVADAWKLVGTKGVPANS